MRRCLFALCLAVGLAAPALSEEETSEFDWTPPPIPAVGINDYGVGGILDIPSARMPDEGQFTFTHSRKDVQDIYAFTYQLMPRLEVAFRYSLPDFRRNSGRTTVPGTFADRSFEIRYNLFRESTYIPTVTLGLRDFGGAPRDGGAEYLVASKKWRDFDLSAGIGWGALAQRRIYQNPFTQISERFNRRVREPGGGQFLTGYWFAGADVGLFGGIRYSIPSTNLKALVSYSSDAYDRWVRAGFIEPPSPWGYGLEWSPVKDIQLGLSWQQGQSWAIRVSASMNSFDAPTRKPPNRFTSDPRNRAPSRQLPESVGWWPRFVNDAEASGLVVPEAQIDDGSRLIVEYRNNAYRLEADAIARVLTLAESYAPPSVTEIIATGQVQDWTTHSVRYARQKLDRPPLLQEEDRISVIEPIEVDRRDFTTRFKRPDIRYNLGVTPRLFLFDPANPFLYEFGARAGADIQFGNGWRLSGAWVEPLGGRFDSLRKPAPTKLIPVRTIQSEYLKDGGSGLDQLLLTQRGQLSSDIFYHLFLGAPEQMYAGAGGEVLWRPFGRSWAVGASAQAVRQRDFNKPFGLRNYKTTAGHVSVYWATPINQFDVALHAGRYLARDVGATLEIQKRLSNGWSIGAFATLTNVPFEDFGEGSFDKGIFLTVPLDIFSNSNTKSRYRNNLRLINRDGGRPVEGPVRILWDQLRDTDATWLKSYSDRMLPE
jgi:hypothetical protein